MDQGDKMLFEQRLAVGEGEGEVLAWGKSISGRGTSTEPWDERAWRGQGITRHLGLP